MKLSDITPLTESVQTFLDLIDRVAEDPAKQVLAAEYVATMMVVRDMDMRYKEEDHPLKANTMVDFLYGDTATTKKALESFRSRILENPRARILWDKYHKQYIDKGFGPKAMQYQIKQLSKYFSQRKVARTQHHERTLVKNFAAAQEKIQKDYQEISD